jgi:integrase
MAAKLEKTATPGIYKRGSRYVIVWEHRGRQHKESFRTMAEAREGKGKRQSGARRPSSRIGFEQYFSEWIESYAGRTSRGFSETTRPEYRRPIVDHAVGRWGTWRLADVEPGDVRDLFGQMRKDGRSTSAIKKLRAALSAMFATAVDDNVLRSNPVAGVRIPAAPAEPIEEEEGSKALTRVDLGILIAAIPDDWRLFFEFLVHSGLRISEAIGLRWEHLDLGDSPHVKVREQFYKGQRKGLKSGAGRRDVPLSPGMLKRLHAHRRDNYAGPKTPVFPSKAGTELLPANVYRRVLAPAAKAVGFKKEVEVDGKTRERSTVSFHTFRHTCASLLFEAGKSIKQVQEWLGHEDPGFTLRTYVHLMDDGLGDADFLDRVVTVTEQVSAAQL